MARPSSSPPRYAPRERYVSRLSSDETPAAGLAATTLDRPIVDPAEVAAAVRTPCRLVRRGGACRPTRRGRAWMVWGLLVLAGATAVGSFVGALAALL
ncbi:MAG TPA: hypothetical protein RMH99_02075 [Sandaracinaceae bacterium LLY-WYZ-13_1]|nr:hypothetical protein [Sandaracinaceae bacterium LLY-WYZ-13_1]